ncbi:MAG: hypothetical protein FWH24_03850 [Oscillospiraceae bacterium]|nr:hypothetical protein [Oscillospiraceae bacterium]
MRGGDSIAAKRKKTPVDEIMKYLFSVSKEMLVTMLNSLFSENFNADDVEIVQTNSEFDDADFKILRGDIFFRIADKTTDKPFHFHMEFQTKRDKLIGIRVFIYDFKKAAENERLEHRGDDDGEVVLYMPKSMVIHVEPNAKIPKDYYRIKIVFTNKDNQEESIDYTVPVMRYWEYNEKKLVDEKLYPLLPLQIFMLRAELEKMSRRKNPQSKRETIAKVKVIAERVVRLTHKLGDEGKLGDEDIEKITTAAGELFKHLNTMYKADTKLSVEVSDMIKTLYDERVFIRGRSEGKAEGKKEEAIEMAKRALRKGISIEDIVELTKLTVQEIEALNEEI